MLTEQLEIQCMDADSAMSAEWMLAKQCQLHGRCAKH
jgi:hypothetical protein